MDFIVVEFHDQVSQTLHDLQLPTFLSGDDLVRALTRAYHLPLDVTKAEQLYLRAEDPIVMIEGNRSLEALGLSNGTRIYFDAR